MRRLGGKKVLVGVLTAAMVAGSAVTALAATGWNQNTTGWWWEYQDGSYATNRWEQVNGVWYFFDQNGYMSRGWIFDNGRWYFANSDGAMQTGWVEVEGQFYYLNPVSDGTRGAMITEKTTVGNVDYVFNENGACTNVATLRAMRIPAYYANGNSIPYTPVQTGSGDSYTGSDTDRNEIVKDANGAVSEGLKDAVESADPTVVGNEAPIVNIQSNADGNSASRNVTVSIVLNDDDSVIDDVPVSGASGDAIYDAAETVLDDLNPDYLLYDMGGDFADKQFSKEEALAAFRDRLNSDTRTLSQVENWSKKVTVVKNGVEIDYTIRFTR